MPLAMMTPEMAQSLVSIGLPYGPNTKRPDAATQSQELSAQLAANPQTNGSQQPAQIDPGAQQASQQDAAAIFSGSQPPPGQAARLQAAQAAVQPARPLETMAVDPNNEDPGANPGFSAGMPLNQSDVFGDTARTLGAPNQMGSPGSAARLQAAQAAAAQQTTQDREAAQNQEAATAPAATPATAPAATGAPLQPGGPSVARDANGLPVPATGAGAPSGAPQAPQATTPPDAAQTPPVTPPTPAQGPVATPPAPVAPKGPVSVEDISNAIYSQESGSGRNTKTSPTGAVGGMQIEPATWKQYAQPGEDINNPTDNRNVGNRIVQDLYQKAGGDPARVAVGYFSGPGNIAPPGSPTPWITDKTDGRTSVSQYVASVTAKLGQPGQFTGATTSSTDYSPAHAQADGSSIGINPAELMKLASTLGYKPVDQDSANNRNLIAMGLGMMGGRTYADSMKNAAGIMSEGNNAMLGVQEKANSNALGLAQVGVADKRADATMRLEQARLVAMSRPRAVGAPTQQADGSWGQMFVDPNTGASEIRPTGSPASYVNSDPNRKANTGLLTTQLKDNEKTIQDYADPHIQTQAQSVIRQANELQELIQRNHNVIGGDITSKFNRYLANITGANLNGLDPNDMSTASKLINQTNTNGIFGQTHGNLQRVTGQEFQKIGGGQVNFDTQPGAALALLEANKQDAQTALAVSSKLNGLSEIDRAHYVSQPGGVDRLINDTLAEINAKRGPTDFKNSPTGVQPAKGVQTQEQPAYTPSAGYVAPNGIKIQFSQ